MGLAYSRESGLSSLKDAVLSGPEHPIPIFLHQISVAETEPKTAATGAMTPRMVSVGFMPATPSTAQPKEDIGRTKNVERDRMANVLNTVMTASSGAGKQKKEAREDRGVRFRGKDPSGSGGYRLRKLGEELLGVLCVEVGVVEAACE